MVHGPSLLCEEFWTTKLTHSSRLLKMIEYMLENRAGAKLNDIDGFVVAGGPGSFTGLRIGISVVKGLSYAMNKPVASVSSLDGIAFRFACSSIPVCAMMDAKRNEVYCSVYHFNNGNLISRTPEIVICVTDLHFRHTNSISPLPSTMVYGRAKSHSLARQSRFEHLIGSGGIGAM